MEIAPISRILLFMTDLYLHNDTINNYFKFKFNAQLKEYNRLNNLDYVSELFAYT